MPKKATELFKLTRFIQWENISNHPPEPGRYLLAMEPKAGKHRVRVARFAGVKKGWLSIAGGSQIRYDRIGWWAHLPNPPDENGSDR